MRVVICNLAADSLLELDDVPTEATISDVKEFTASSIQLPSVFQEVILGSAILADSQQVGTLCGAGESTLSLTVVINLACVEDPDVRTRCSAVENLALLAGKWRESAVAAAYPRLEDPEWSVRRAAVFVVRLALGSGCERALASILFCTADADVDVRRAAVLALGDVAGCGHERATTALGLRLSDEDGDVRDAAVSAIILFAEADHHHAFSALIHGMRGPHLLGKVTAWNALIALAKRGHLHSIGDALSRLPTELGGRPPAQRGSLGGPRRRKGGGRHSGGATLALGDASNHPE